MQYAKPILLLFVVFYILGISTLHMWSHPEFVLILAGIVGTIYRKLHPSHIKRRVRT